MIFNKIRSNLFKHNINHTLSSFASLPAYARDCGCLFGLKSRWITTERCEDSASHALYQSSSVRKTQMQLANVFAQTHQWARLAKGKPKVGFVCQSGGCKQAERGERR